MRYETVPADAAASFTFREFRWPRFPFNWHCHPEAELTFIARGRGLRFVGDSVEQFADGDLCLLGADTPHCWASEAGATPRVRSLVVQFVPEKWGRSFWDLPETRRMGRLLERARRGLVVQGQTRKTVSQMMLQLTRQPAGSWQRLSQLLEMLGRLAESADCRELASSQYQARSGVGGNRRLGEALSYIHAHLGANLTQRDAARTVGQSPQAFSRFFRRVLGKTYVAYVNELRVLNACQALIESDAPITEVAYGAGFGNLSNFNAQFRRLKRTTPRDYRAQARAGWSADDAGAARSWPGTIR